MTEPVFLEVERLYRKAASRRESLLRCGLAKGRRRKVLNIIAGSLSLLSAATITTVLADVFGQKGVQLAAALIAGVSGTLCLVITAHYSDEEIVNMIRGSSEYLTLRESLNRLMLDPQSSDQEAFKCFATLQEQYARLDQAYARHFRVSNPPTESLAEYEVETPKHTWQTRLRMIQDDYQGYPAENTENKD